MPNFAIRISFSSHLYIDHNLYSLFFFVRNYYTVDLTYHHNSSKLKCNNMYHYDISITISTPMVHVMYHCSIQYPVNGSILANNVLTYTKYTLCMFMTFMSTGFVTFCALLFPRRYLCRYSYLPT